MTRDMRPTLSQAPPFASCRALVATMNDPSPAPGPVRQACVGHAFINGDPCWPGHDVPGMCVLSARRRARRAQDYLNAKGWRANEVKIGPTGYRNHARFEMLAHGVLCGHQPEGCTCPPGYAAWWHSLPAPHPVVRFFEVVPGVPSTP